MDLHRGLGLAEPRPGKQGHAKIHDRRVQGVDGLINLLDEPLLRVQLPRLSDEDPCELEVDAPVPPPIGVGEIASGNRSADAYRVYLRVQTAGCPPYFQQRAASDPPPAL